MNENQQKIIRATNMADLLAVLPGFAGFVATNSLFILPMRGNQMRGVARLDLPAAASAPDSPEAVEELADWCVELMRSVPPLTRVVLVLVTDERFADQADEAPPLEAFGALLMALLEAAGCEVRDCIVQAADGFSSLEPGMAEWHALSEITLSVHYSDKPMPSVDQWRDENPAASISAEELHRRFQAL